MSYPSEPVILIHGFGDSPTTNGLWEEAERMLDRVGVSYLTVKLPPCQSILERSASLRQQISAKYRGQTVHFIAHSMGGLNARHVASESDKNDFMIRTVTTFGTPHYGLKVLSYPLRAAAEAFERFLHQGGLQDMTLESMNAFNTQYGDNPNVTYFSWAGKLCRLGRLIHPVYVTSMPLLASCHSGDNDGIIAVESARYGRYLGTLEGVDHITMMTAENIGRTLPHLAAAERNETLGDEKVDNSLLTRIDRRVDGEADVMRAAFKYPARFLAEKTSINIQKPSDALVDIGVGACKALAKVPLGFTRGILHR